MIFQSEKDLREFIKTESLKWPSIHLFRVEYAMGGTDGMSDIIACNNGLITFFELKCFKTPEEVKLRKTQNKTLGLLHDSGARVVVLTAEKGGSKLWVSSIPGLRSGKAIDNEIEPNFLPNLFGPMVAPEDNKTLSEDLFNRVSDSAEELDNMVNSIHEMEMTVNRARGKVITLQARARDLSTKITDSWELAEKLNQSINNGKC